MSGPFRLASAAGVGDARPHYAEIDSRAKVVPGCGLSTGFGVRLWCGNRAGPHSRSVINDRRDVALLVSTDPLLGDHVRRIAAAAGRPLVERSAPPDRAARDGAAVLLLDGAAARAVATRGTYPGAIVVVRGTAGVDEWRSAAAIGTRHVMGLPADESLLVSLLASEPTTASAPGAGVVTVIGGCGGAGASLFASALGLVGSRSHRTLLVDADAIGGGLDLVLGWEEEPGLRWADLVVVDGGRVESDSLHHALPSRDGLTVLSAGRGETSVGSDLAVSVVVESGRRGGDLVICDAPRGAGEAREACVDAADLVVLVVPARVRAAAASMRTAAAVSAGNANVGVVVRGPSPTGLTAADVADMVSLPLLAACRAEPRVESMVDGHGLVLRRRSPLARAAGTVLGMLADRADAS